MSPEVGSKKTIGAAAKRFILLLTVAGMVIVFVFLSVMNLLEGESSVGSSEPRVVKEAREQMELPPERPEIHDVREADILRAANPRVYGKVQNGDVILEFETVIVVYRSSERVIVDVIEK